MPDTSLLSFLTATSVLPDETAVWRFMSAAFVSLPEISSARFTVDDGETYQQGEAEEDAEVLALAVRRQGKHYADLALTVDRTLPSHVVYALRNAANVLSLEIHRRRFRDEVESEIAQRVSQHAQLLERFELAVSAAELGLWEWDFETSEIVLDERGLAMYRWPDGEPFSFERWLSMVHPDDAEKAEGLIQQSLNQLKDFAGEFRVGLPCGQMRHIKVSSRTVYHDNGKPRRIVGTIQDVTEVRDLHEQLTRAQRLESIGQLTGGIAHDFNNILNAISGNTELLQLSDGLPESEQKELLAGISRSVDRGASLTSRLLTFARKKQLSPEIVNVNRAFDHLWDILKVTLRDDIGFDLQVASNLPRIEVDLHQFDNAILNLIINARDATANGGTITLEAVQHTVHEPSHSVDTTIQPGSYLRISVKDTGCGISPEDLNRVIDPFFTTKPAGEGTGLGLSTVHGFVRQSGGFVSIWSEVGKGTEVTLLFPATSVEVTETENEISSTDSDRQIAIDFKGHALLVEDDEAVSRVSRMMLERLGYDVRHLANGKDAMSAFDQDPDKYCVVLTDISLPGAESGIDVAHHVHQIRPDLKIVFTSGYPQALEDDADLSLRQQTFLPKPFRLHQLTEAVLGS